MTRNTPQNIALVALTADGSRLARRLQTQLPGAELLGLRARVADCDTAFDDVSETLTGLFRAGRPIVGICAAGILIRTLAPELADKQNEPPVLALAPDGSNIVPLLGGHHGANTLAQRIADITGGNAALTTAGEIAYGIALDAPPSGWTLGNPERAKDVMAGLLAGQAPCLVIEAGDPGWLADMPTDHDGTWMIRITDRNIAANANELLMHPPSLVVGVGCERDCSAAELHALVHETLSGAGLSPASVTAIVSIDVKADEPAVHALADDLGVPARFFPAAVLEAETPRLANPSDVVFREVGAHGVAEAAALAASGPQGSLIVPKHKSRRATCAIARATHLDANEFGRARGHLSIVGTGPGDTAHRIPATDRAVAQAQDLVGYGPYLDLLGPATRVRNQTGAATRLISQPRGAMSRLSPAETPGSLPWRRWSSNCSTRRTMRHGGGCPSMCTPAFPQCSWPPPVPVPRWDMTSAPFPCPTC